MSGGYFDYQQYRIGEIADSIEREIERATAPRPDKVKDIEVAVYFHNSNIPSRREYSRELYDTFERAVKELKASLRLKLQGKTKTTPDGLRERTYEVQSLYSIQNDRVTIKEYINEHYPLDEDGYEQYYPDYTPETLEIFRTAVRKLREAEIYAQRIDWLLCGDDREDTLKQRLQEELQQLEQN